MTYTHILDHSKPIQKYFEEISRIPRNSCKEKNISDYVAAFAKERGLWYFQDSLWNVIVKKPASLGFENAEPVMLQGHMDMVCIKSPDSTHDFSKDPIELFVDNGILRARGTSLGADNGVAIAYMLSILENDTINHPALECVFTVQEESGIDGAKYIDESKISAHRMIGLDGSGETSSFVACYCSDSIELIKDISFKEVEGAICTFKISRLNINNPGDIVHQECSNAIKTAARLLNNLVQQEIPLSLCGFDGGVAENLNPAECTVSFACRHDLLEKSKASLLIEFDNLMKEFQNDKYTAAIEFIDDVNVKGMLSSNISEEIISLLYLLPNNAFQWNFNINEMTAVNNIGLISMNEESLRILMSTRARYESAALQLKEHCSLLASHFSFKIYTKVRYRPWPYNPSSYVRKIANEVFIDVLGKPLEEAVCPGGLEIAIFTDKIPKLDAIMIGPICKNFHTTNEWLDLASYDRMYDVLVKILAKLN